MAKKTFTVPKSATDTIVTVDIPDPVIRQGVIKFAPGDNGAALTNPDITWTQGDPVITQTPVAVEPPPVVVPPTTTRKNLIQESLFNTTDLATALKGWSDMQHNLNAPWSRTIVNNTLRFEVRPGDESSGSIRSEITMEIKGDVWIGFKLKLENFNQDSKGGGESIGIQWHGNDGQNNPPLSLNLYGTDISLVQCPDDKSLIQNNIAKLTDWNNKWVSLVFHTNWNTLRGGVEMWVDGVKKVNKTGINMGANDVNLKIGQNHWSWFRVSGITQKSRIFYIDDLRIGNSLATYADVAP